MTSKYFSPIAVKKKNKRAYHLAISTFCIKRWSLLVVGQFETFLVGAPLSYPLLDKDDNDEW